ncbi:MAG: hypothetical protein QM627_01295 [Luteolibacter sp.]
MKLYPYAALILPVLFLLAGCSGKSVGDNYYIRCLEEGDPYLYYLEKNGERTPGGVFDGIVKEIAWQGDEVVARVQRLSSSDKSGWYKLNIKTGKMEGPIEDFEIYQGSAMKIEDFYLNPQQTK